MEDVLTPDERKHIEWMRKWLKDMGIAHGSGTIELSIVDRLVARVELLETLICRALAPADGMSKEWYEDAVASLEPRRIA